MGKKLLTKLTKKSSDHDVIKRDHGWEVFKSEIRRIALTFIQANAHISGYTTPDVTTGMLDLIQEQEYYAELPNAIHYQPYLEYIPAMYDAEICIELDDECANLNEAICDVIEGLRRWATKKKISRKYLFRSKIYCP